MENWVLLSRPDEPPSTFLHLQSMDDPSVCFAVMVNAEALFKEFDLEVPDDHISIAILAEEGGELVCNLSGLILVREETRTGRQVCNDSLPCAQPVCAST